MTSKERAVIEAQKLPMIKELKAVDLADPIRKAVTGAYFIKGNKEVSNVDLKAIVEYVAKTLKESFSTYRIPEICQAIELGARGELYKENDMNVVSPENIFKWIHRYNEVIRKEAIHKQKQFEEKKEKELSEAQREAERQKFVDQMLAIYKAFPAGFKMQNKGSLAWMYNYLDKRGMIHLSVQRKKEIFEGVQRIRERVRYWPKKLIPLSDTDLSKYRALYQVFKDWKEFDLNLKEELTEKDKRS